MKTVCKVRGITMNYNESQPVNFDTIEDLVLNRPANSTVTVHTSKKFKRKRGEGEYVSIVKIPEDKIYSISFFKRRHRDFNTSFPYGNK